MADTTSQTDKPVATTQTHVKPVNKVVDKIVEPEPLDNVKVLKDIDAMLEDVAVVTRTLPNSDKLAVFMQHLMAAQRQITDMIVTEVADAHALYYKE